jgi:hypothetical protein
MCDVFIGRSGFGALSSELLQPGMKVVPAGHIPNRRSRATAA